MPENKTPKNIFKGMSINKQQAAALADQFLDDIGTDDKDTLQPKETFTELFLLAGEFVDDAQKNLKQSNSIASGSLSNSLVLGEPTETGNILSVDVLMNFYGDFINKGVRGTKSGQGKYRFKSAFPSEKMVKALEKGILRARQSTGTVKKYKAISKYEVKQRTISAIDKAYGAGRNIKMYGIKPVGFIDKAVVTTTRKVSDRLGAAFRIDIINSI